LCDDLPIYHIYDYSNHLFSTPAIERKSDKQKQNKTKFFFFFYVVFFARENKVNYVPILYESNKKSNKKSNINIIIVIIIIVSRSKKDVFVLSLYNLHDVVVVVFVCPSKEKILCCSDWMDIPIFYVVTTKGSYCRLEATTTTTTTTANSDNYVEDSIV
jgi:hypothetical protein